MRRVKEGKASLQIVIMVTYTYPYIGSGIGNVARVQAEKLAEEGHRVTLISSNFPKSEREFMHRKVSYMKVWATDFLERFHVPVPILFFNMKVIKALFQADVVHVHDILYPSSFAAALFGKIFLKRIILTQHVPHVVYTNKIINVIEKIAFYTMGLLTLALVDQAVVLNMTVFNWLQAYKKKVMYLPNGVDLNLFNKAVRNEKIEIRRKYHLPAKAWIVLFVGRFVPKKGFDILYQARDRKYLLVFVGGGTVPENMHEDKSVRILGPRPQEELALIYKACDMFILPSNGEGFPLSIQEAMASGLAIVTSNENNLDQTIDSPFIHFIDVTPNAIRNAILQIKNNPQQANAMSAYSLLTAQAHYSWEKNITTLLAIYNNTYQTYAIPKKSTGYNKLG